MIYIETITDNEDTFRIERQKDTTYGKWYGIRLVRTDGDKLLSDKESWLIDFLKEEECFKNMSEKENRLARKILKKADRLGWFLNQ